MGDGENPNVVGPFEINDRKWEPLEPVCPHRKHPFYKRKAFWGIGNLLEW
jgi:hypothetical protein